MSHTDTAKDPGGSEKGEKPALEKSETAVEPVGPRLRRLRLASGMSARAVAGRADVSPSYLSRLERGQVSPNVSTLLRITDALGQPAAALFDDHDAPGPVVRKKERRTMVGRNTVDALLSPTRSGRLEVFEMKVEPKASSGRAYTHWGEEECVVVLDGHFEVTIGDSTYLLDEGDAVTWSCRTPHEWRNPGKGPATVLWIITPGGG